MDDDPDIYGKLVFRTSPAIVFILVACWLGLAVSYPMVWALVTGTLLLFGFGLFTARFIFGVQSIWTALALSPLFGGCWLAFFYVVFRIFGSQFD